MEVVILPCGQQICCLHEVCNNTAVHLYTQKATAQSLHVSGVRVQKGPVAN